MLQYIDKFSTLVILSAAILSNYIPIIEINVTTSTTYFITCVNHAYLSLIQSYKHGNIMP